MNLTRGGGSITVDIPRELQAESMSFHPQMSPIMSEETFYDIEKAISQRIGKTELPEDEIMYLFTEPGENALSNPPVLCFAFAARPGLIMPEDITVKLNDTDISAEVHYNYFYEQGRKANFYLAHFKPKNYLNPQRNHTFDISLAPQSGGSFDERKTFSVPNDDRLKIIRAAVFFDRDRKMPDFGQLIVDVLIPDDVDIGDSLLDPANWNLVYDDRVTSLAINQIQRSPAGTYLISLTEDATPGQNVMLTLSPSEGIYTEEYELHTPYDRTNRGGSAMRQAMSSCCIGGFHEEPTLYHNAEGCENFHLYVHNVDCPPSPCSAYMWWWGTETVYSFCDKEEDYVTKDSCAGHPEGFELWGGTSCKNINHAFSYDRDYTINYWGEIYDHAGNVCEELGNIGPINFTSDTTPPTVVASILEPPEILCPDGGENCEPCEEYQRYTLQVTWTDDQCIRGYLAHVNPLFYYIYKANCDPQHQYATLIRDVRHSPPPSDTEITRRFFVQQKDLACVAYIKVIAFDRKGNWNSTKVYDLPYPDTLTLSFDDENRESDRQYVNLAPNAITPWDQEVCLYKNEYPDHGPFIYVEITVDPPIQGIPVRVDFGDPAFSMDGNSDPTNYRDINNTDPGAYSASNNPDLTDDEYYLLWGSHSPWVEDSLKELGDNYNYYHKHTWSSNPNSTFQQYLDQHGVPEDDPIRRHPPADIPCFDDCGVVPVGHSCANGDCNSPYTLTTNIYGKAATYFNTMGHGGDNFTFRAYTENLPRCPEPCLDSGESRTFTNWRKIYVDYAWMEYRTRYPDPECEIHGVEQIEFNGPYLIGTTIDAFSHFQGVFDDGFLEIEKTEPTIANTPYHLALDNSDGVHFYTYLHDIFEGSPTRVMLIGVDHIIGQCVFRDPFYYLIFGVALMPINDRRNFVAVGLYIDYYSNPPYEPRVIDGIVYGENPYYPIVNTAAHELGHSIIQIGHICEEGPGLYGLMTAGTTEEIYIDGEAKPARRSYFHGRNIMRLRSGSNTFNYYPVP